jgi:hypothetical protein
MGLDVSVEGDKPFGFSVGYISFTAFRDALVGVIRGKAAAEAQAKERMRAMTEMLFPGKDMEAIMARMMGGRAAARPAPRAPSRPKTMDDRTLDIFLNHCDSSGDFSHEECVRLYKVFKKNRTKFRQSGNSPQMKELFENFMRAFKRARDGGEDGKVVFH